MRCLAILLFVVPLASFAQGPVPVETPEGRRLGAVFAVEEDPQGFVWLGTAEGLYRYDGHAFRAYRLRSRTQGPQPGTTVRDIHIADDGALWIVTQEGDLGRLDRSDETFSWIPLRGSARGSARVNWRLGSDTSGRLWVGHADASVTVVDPATGGLWRRALRERPPVGEKVKSLLRRPDDEMWIVLSETVARWQDGRFDRLQLDAPEACLLADLALGVRGAIWTAWSCTSGAESRVMVYGPDGTGSPLATHILDALPLDFAPLPDGTVWVGTSKGVVRLAPSNGVPLERHSGEEVVRLTVGQSGRLWIGTITGLYVMDLAPPPFAVIGVDLSNPYVNAITSDAAGALWIGTADGLVRRDPGTGRTQTYRLPARGRAPLATRIWSLHESPGGPLWVGTGGQGLYRFDRQRLSFELVTLPFHVGRLRDDSQRIRSITRTASGDLWATITTGLLRFSDSTPSLIAHGSLSSAFGTGEGVSTVLPEASGGLWLGTDRGLFHYDLASDRSRRISLGDARGTPERIWPMLLAADGDLWLGTVGDGLIRFDPARGEVERFTSEDGFATNAISGLLQADDGAIWTSTLNGLYRLDPETRALERYGREDGLPSHVFNTLAAHRAPDGTMHFGGPDGVVSFHPDSVRAPAPTAPVLITQVRVFDERLPGIQTSGDSVRLEHDANFFSVTFGSTGSPRGASYRYRLTGVDRDWRHSESQPPTASYTDVAPGTYTFTVERLDRMGQATTSAHLVFDLRPAWWQRRSIQALGLLAALILLSGTVVQRQRLRTAALRADRDRSRREVLRLVESRDDERARLARELHDGPLQGLYTLGHHIDTVGESLLHPPEAVSRARAEADDVAREIRDVCGALRPPALDSLGPVVALRSHIDRLASRPGAPRVEIRQHADGRSLPPLAQQALYRVGQEAITNAVQHAEASEISIHADGHARGLRLVVTDNGRGFDPELEWSAYAAAGHYGLVGAHERIQAVGGTLHIESRPGHGTTLTVWVSNVGEPETTPG